MARAIDKLLKSTLNTAYIAKQAKMSESTIKRFFKKGHDPRLSTIIKIAKSLDMTTEEVLSLRKTVIENKLAILPKA